MNGISVSAERRRRGAQRRLRGPTAEASPDARGGEMLCPAGGLARAFSVVCPGAGPSVSGLAFGDIAGMSTCAVIP